MTNKKKKIIIIGGGISGMTAGIYALENGYDVTIYEKHSIIGGQCTGWYRQGVFIDGCAHWIVGTNPSSSLYPLWRHVGAFSSNDTIYDTEYYCKYDINGEVVTFYADLEKLENEFLRVSPEDKKAIRKFINGVKIYRHVQIPLSKPLDCMNIFELTAHGIKMLPMVPAYIKSRKISIKEYAKNFKSNILKEVFNRILTDGYNIHSLFYVLNNLASNNAGVVQGGSLKIANNIKNTFINKGGKILTNKEVDHILIKDNVACGVVFKNNEVVESDYVISSCDINHTLNTLLQGKYHDKFYEERFNNNIDNPLTLSVLLSYKVNKILNGKPKMINFKTDDLYIGPMKIDNISIRNHSFDTSIYKKDAVLTVLIDVKECVYDYYNSLNKEEYLKAKNNLGNEIKNRIMAYFDLNDNQISLLDVATPLTYQRYTNAYKGSYMSFVTTKKTKGLMRKGIIRPLKNFVLAGQWLMPPGGLPIALFTGKHAAYRITKMDKKNFIDLDVNYQNTTAKNGLREIS